MYRPTQLAIQGQWWSIFKTHTPQVEQWWARGGLGPCTRPPAYKEKGHRAAIALHAGGRGEERRGEGGGQKLKRKHGQVVHSPTHKESKTPHHTTGATSHNGVPTPTTTTTTTTPGTFDRTARCAAPGAGPGPPGPPAGQAWGRRPRKSPLPHPHPRLWAPPPWWGSHPGHPRTPSRLQQRQSHRERSAAAQCRQRCRRRPLGLGVVRRAARGRCGRCETCAPRAGPCPPRRPPAA